VILYNGMTGSLSACLADATAPPGTAKIAVRDGRTVAALMLADAGPRPGE
jgi:hypothetical protein